MLSDITAARDAALASIDSASTLDEVNALTSRLTGKKGDLAQLKTSSARSTRSTTRRPPARRSTRRWRPSPRPSRVAAHVLGDEALNARIEMERLDLTEVLGPPDARPRRTS